MKRYIHSDWDYSSSDEVNALKELMSANIERQEDPKVGIFWYDSNNHELFGVRSANVEDVRPYTSNLFGAEVKTCTPLHYKVWDKEYYRKKDKRFSGDYTLVPRGRVFYVDGSGFVVIVGSWINDYPEAKAEIIEEFDLPEDIEFQIDSHWDIGHGWSDKFM